MRNCLASASDVRFPDGIVLFRLPLLERGVSPGVSFRECFLLLLDLDDFDERTGVTKMASGAGVDGPVEAQPPEAAEFVVPPV